MCFTNQRNKNMLTIDILKSNSVLSGLTEEQLKAIAKMSETDENTVIGNKIRDLHNQYDADVLSITGIAKDNDEKSYNYVKRVLGKFKTDTAEIEALKKDKKTLEEKIASGSQDETLKTQLKDTSNKLKQMETQFSTAKQEWEKEKAGLAEKVVLTKADYVFAQAVSGMKFKASIPESIRKVVIENAKNEILRGKKIDFTEDGNMVFRDENGNILNNPANGLQPYTASDLMKEQLKDALDAGRGAGAGTSGKGAGKGAGTGVIDFSMAKTQVQADDLIAKHLMDQGLTRDNPVFAEKAIELREENKIGELPLR